MNNIGIDYSLTSPATVVICPDGKIYAHAYAKKKQQGIIEYENWTFHIEEILPYSSEQERYNNLANRTMSFIRSYGEVSGIRIEGYSYGSKGQVFNLAENGGVLKHKLFEASLPFQVIAPTTVKKYATGKGNADKNKMYNSFVEKVGFDLKKVLNDTSKEGKVGSPTSDIVDAYFIAASIADSVPDY